MSKKVAMFSRLCASLAWCFRPRRQPDLGEHHAVLHAAAEGGGHTALNFDRAPGSKEYVVWPIKSWRICTKEQRDLLIRDAASRGCTIREFSAR